MKKKKGQCQCDGPFARISGLIMMFVGALGLVLTFISKGINNASYLSTELQGAGINSTTFENEMSWEVIMVLSLSIALVIGGVIILLASRKISEN